MFFSSNASVLQSAASTDLKDGVRGTRGPRLCFISTMLGRRPGFVTSPGQILSDLFSREGYDVVSTSSVANRYLRLLDVAATIIKNRKKFDIAVIDVFGGPSIVIEDLASFLCRLFGRQVIMYLHGGALPEFSARFPRWTRRVFKRAGAIVAPSKFLARELQPAGLSIRIIPNVIEIAKYPYRRRARLQPRLFWMRSFHPIYDPELAIKVFATVKKLYPGASLVMAGQDKGQESEVRALAVNLGLEHSIRFAGFLDSNGKALEGSNADLFLNTSRVDNMPVVLIEACAMGLPVVTTNAGGIPDLLTEGVTGLLAPVSNESAISSAVIKLLENPELAERLSQNGITLARCSSWENVLPLWNRAFADVRPVEVEA